MDIKDKIKRGLRHPVTVVGGVAGTLTAVLDPNTALAIWGAIWAQLGTLFTATSISAFTLAEHVPDLEPFKPFLVWAAVAFAALYLAKLGDRVIDEVEDRL